MLSEIQVKQFIAACENQTWVSVNRDILLVLLKQNLQLAEAKKVIDQYRSNHKSSGSHHHCALDPLWSDYICEQCKDADRFIAKIANQPASISRG